MALLSEENGQVCLSPECREALEEVFQRVDLDGNGFISRTEFDFFQERTSGEICDDEAWKVIQGEHMSNSVYVHDALHVHFVVNNLLLYSTVYVNFISTSPCRLCLLSSASLWYP